ncbi:hypothetical protein N9F37_01160 [bacterium]|nr:hypothetical protein [Akkermansiaceae bacterium]MDA8972955.1 hypothetical protein [bacterium]MDB4455755.1 hypothetical protein [bacterium]MDB4458256.1 hypothetical protein [Akkermansiaceae bacterium]MDB4505504.1 hypothetical protein [bacterium]
MDVSQLEPADRDPVKLRNTALILVGVMIIGAVTILWAYSSFGKRTAQSDRPSMEAKITDDCRMITADGEERDIQDLKGKVTLSLITTIEEGSSEDVIAPLRKVYQSFPEGAEKPNLLVFVLDGSEESPEKMAGVLSEFDSVTDVWRVAAGEDGKVSVRAFLKNRMRFGVYPNKSDDEWSYDSKLVLLDQFLHLRGIPGSNKGWVFEVVTGMEEKFAAAEKVHLNKELMPPYMTTERLTKLLIESINYLYANPQEKGQK